jgi:hypothetical protein
MPFISGLVQNVFILRWQKTELADAARAVRLVKKAKQQWSGPLVYVGIVPAGERGPDKETRIELGRELDELLGLCSCIHLVLEGKGFAAATQRAVAAGIFLMTGMRGRVTPHPSVAHALNSCGHLEAPAAIILAEATELGLVLEVARAESGTRENRPTQATRVR